MTVMRKLAPLPPTAGLAWLALTAPARADDELDLVSDPVIDALVSAVILVVIVALWGAGVVGKGAWVRLSAALRRWGWSQPLATPRSQKRAAGDGGGPAVARLAGAPGAISWEDPSFDLLERLLASRNPDRIPAEGAEGRRYTHHELTRLHPRFDPIYIHARVSAIFPRIQRAWSAEDLALAADCLAGPGRQALQIQLDANAKTPHRNVVEDPELSAVTPVVVRDRLADDRDTLYVEIAGTLIDYDVQRADGEPVDPRQTRRQTVFKEIWRLAWQPQGWVLAGIHAGAKYDEALAERNVSL